MPHYLFMLLIIAPSLLVAVILHEIAHGVVAEKLGDPTARQAGRITLNPIKHIDLYMTIIVPVLLIMAGSPVVVGGAKPVPINALNFRHPRQEMGLVALAGPITNFILAFFSYLLFLFLTSIFSEETVLSALFLQLVIYSVIINLVLGVFNLIPVPPLDGGRIAVAILPLPLARILARLEPFGLVLVVLLLLSGALNLVLSPLIKFALNLLS